MPINRARIVKIEAKLRREVALRRTMLPFERLAADDTVHPAHRAGAWRKIGDLWTEAARGSRENSAARDGAFNRARAAYAKADSLAPEPSAVLRQRLVEIIETGGPVTPMPPLHPAFPSKPTNEETLGRIVERLSALRRAHLSSLN
jgi:hypothetical protein